MNFTKKLLLGIFQWFCLKISDDLFYRTPLCIFVLLLKPGPGPWTWTLKNIDPGKHEINMGLKNMSDFRELCSEKKSQFLLIKYSVPKILIQSTNLFRIKSLNAKFPKYQKHRQNPTSERFLLKIKIAAPDKFSEVAGRRYFSK